jgi:N-methylhydantoinase A
MRVATDVGGTFTDLVYLDEATGAVDTTKVPTTPPNFADGVVNALGKAGRDAAQIGYFVHGATLVINALTERKGVKTGLITTRGFRDVLEIGRANRPDIYNMRYRKPEPFVPRHLRLEVTERVSHQGEILALLVHSDVETAAAHFSSEGVRAIAVCFLHSYANPTHEKQCREILNRLMPGIPITLSCEITQQWREYERTNTAVLNSYVHPIVQSYLDDLESHLCAMGVARSALHVMQSNGGSATFEAGKNAPINLVESGPVAGVIGAAHIGTLIGETNVISLDIGGTTAKTSLIQNGHPRITTEYKIDHRHDYAGYPILAPTIDIVEIGAGGGSIAWIDSAGALRVGPVSAGADPGPAAYGIGGDRPTVTDANVLAGRINPEYFLGGEIPLDVDGARVAMQPIAAAFDLSVEQASMGVIRLADASMMNALKLVSIRRGYDPRDFVLVAFGGGGAMHGAALMRELRVKKVVIPTMPAVFSAWGMLMADLRRDYIRTLVARTDRITQEQINHTFAEMGDRARHDMAAEGIGPQAVALQRYADMRYLGQNHTVKVIVPDGETTPATIPEINEHFHRLHEQTYTFRLDTPVELVNYHLTAFGRVNTPSVQQISGDGLNLRAARKGARRVNFDELGFHQAEIYERDLLPLNTPIRGPLVVEEPTSTTVVFPDQHMIRDEYGFLHIEPGG